MRLSVESYVPRERFGDFEGLRMIAQAGFDCVDYSFYWAKEDFPMYGDGYREYALRLRAHLDELGLVCNQAHAPFSVEYDSPFTEQDPHYRNVVRSIEAAAILGANSIVVHALCLPGKRGTPQEDAYSERYYRSLAPYAEKAGIRIAVENLFYTDRKSGCTRGMLGSPEALNELLGRLASDRFVACVDLGHASIVGYEPEAFLAGVEERYLQALHVQDTDYHADRHQLPFLADLNWPAVMNALKQKNYRGDLTFELTGYLRRMPDALLPDALQFANRVGRYLLSL